MTGPSHGPLGRRPALEPPASEGLAEARRLLADQLPVITSELVPSLVEEVIERVRDSVPDYARPRGGPYDQVLRAATERNIMGFLDWMVDPGRPLDKRDELCRKVGAFEVMEGRPLAVLEAAYRIGTGAAWARIRAQLADRSVSVQAIAALAEALAEYMDQAAALSREGYERARDVERTAARLLLLRGLARGEPATEVPAAADWRPPEQVTMVALPPGSPLVRPLLDADVLLDAADPAPYLLVPGPFSHERREMLEASLAGGWAVAGLTVPPASAGHSLRWARRLLELATDGVVDGAGTGGGDGRGLLLCEDHIMTLWLLADEPLMARIADRAIVPLAWVSERRRQRLIETLELWLRTRGRATTMSRELGMHVQTVRYRTRLLDQLMGDDLADSDRRFAIEASLRALRLRGRTPNGE
ncbi:helix-turn-helix domain-containing protein [Actinomadura nitritigenes]|uniref:PucR family transcriptional regulator n=1 Tax=Actinomadura nitritigenes TaxID=134602 RepID=UPI0036916B3E